MRITEDNFIFEFSLNENGMIKEIKTEFDIVRFLFSKYSSLGEDYRDMLDRMMVMPLRKLLCEDTSVLFKVCPDFKMPAIHGSVIPLLHGMNTKFLDLKTEPESQWLAVKDWLENSIAWIDRDTSSMPDFLDETTYGFALNKMKKIERTEFESYFTDDEISNENGDKIAIKRINKVNRIRVFEMLKAIGFYDLSLYNFIKHISDKRGAHIDVGYSLILKTLNRSLDPRLSAIAVIAIQMIYAAMKQIPQLSDYWPELLEIMNAQ